MEGPTLINFLYLVVSCVLMALAIPLLLEKIGPNGLYGFRTARTQSDPKIWYAVNKSLGKGQLIAGGALLATTLLVHKFGLGLGTAAVALIDLGVIVVGLGVAIAIAAGVAKK